VNRGRPSHPIGDKTDVRIKPRVFAERGFVFVSANYGLMPYMETEILIQDVAKSLGEEVD
jgi:hypothetical protein